MSIPVGTFIDELAIQCNNPAGTADAAFISQIWSKVREAYREVASSYNWSCLQSVATLNNTTFLVPADCRIINSVQDSDKNPYNLVANANCPSDFNRNYYFAPPISTVLAEGTTLNVGEYATAVSSTAEFTATTCVNEFIRVASNPSIYRIKTWTDASNIVLQDNFRGDQQSNVAFQIRPKGTMVLGFSDASGSATTPTDIQINYTRIPLLPYSKNDVLELPGDCQAVEIKALMKLLSLLGFNSAADRKSTEYTIALSQMKASEPRQPIVRPTSMFQDRRYARGKGYVRGLSDLNGKNW